jgi:hypothetical protein
VTVAQLKRRIETACGSRAQQVQVTGQGPKTVQVRLMVRTEKEGQELARTILELPELSPYEVNLSVDIGR